MGIFAEIVKTFSIFFADSKRNIQCAKCTQFYLLSQAHSVH